MQKRFVFFSLKDSSLKNTLTEDGIVIAAGMVVKRSGDDFHDVFRRADEEMYAQKNLLKQKRPGHNLR